MIWNDTEDLTDSHQHAHFYILNAQIQRVWEVYTRIVNEFHQSAADYEGCAVKPVTERYIRKMDLL